MPKFEATDNEILSNLLGEECLCGDPKGKRQSFCRFCYAMLPGIVKRQLYTAWANGYPDIFRGAVDTLYKQATRGNFRDLTKEEVKDGKRGI